MGLKEKIEGFLGLLEGIDKDVISEEKLKGLYLGVLDEKDLEIIDGIVMFPWDFLFDLLFLK